MVVDTVHKRKGQVWQHVVVEASIWQMSDICAYHVLANKKSQIGKFTAGASDKHSLLYQLNQYKTRSGKAATKCSNLSN